MLRNRRHVLLQLGKMIVGWKRCPGCVCPWPASLKTRVRNTHWAYASAVDGVWQCLGRKTFGARVQFLRNCGDNWGPL